MTIEVDIKAEIEREYARHNRQLKKRIELLSRFRTKKYMSQLRELMKDAGVFAVDFVKDTGRGKKQKSDYPAIKWEWVDQQVNGGYSGDEYAGYIYIQVKPTRFLRLHYSM